VGPVSRDVYAGAGAGSIKGYGSFEALHWGLEQGEEGKVVLDAWGILRHRHAMSVSGKRRWWLR
jgi:hypothetical protein